ELKAVAIDTLSIENLNEAGDNGYFVHHAFLDHEKYDEPTMLIYEDVNPEPLIGKNLKSAFAAPLRIVGHDASIVNVIVETEEYAIEGNWIYYLVFRVFLLYDLFNQEMI